MTATATTPNQARQAAMLTLAGALARLATTETDIPTSASDHAFTSWQLEVGRREKAVVVAAREYLRATVGSG
ncbi:MAG: hypothetical protein M3N43_06925 [Actinomycetota bacterium]|nr:hypothetical protein [Actinomycetota bacterium]